jgi:hypothetical protein
MTFGSMGKTRAAKGHIVILILYLWGLSLIMAKIFAIFHVFMSA